MFRVKYYFLLLKLNRIKLYTLVYKYVETKDVFVIKLPQKRNSNVVIS